MSEYVNSRTGLLAGHCKQCDKVRQELSPRGYCVRCEYNLNMAEQWVSPSKDLPPETTDVLLEPVNHEPVVGKISRRKNWRELDAWPPEKIARWKYIRRA